jgi:AcrR family transcriptional regulator
VRQQCREDRRVQRTKRSLRHAMAALIHEKPFAAIAVKEIVARADVGRSAFYAHFHDKDDLLASAIRETLRACTRAGQTANDAEHLVRFSRPLLEHIARAGLRVEGPGAPDVHAPLHARVRSVLVEQLLLDLRKPGYESSAVPAQLLAEHVADSFLQVIHWWLRETPRRSPADADSLFRMLVLPTVHAVVRGGGRA